MSEMTVGCIRTTATPPLSGGIYEALLEKTERERDDALERLKDCGSHMMQVCKELEAGEMDCAIDAAIMVMGRLKRAEKDSAELADRLSGLELSTANKLAELERERDHYKQALEEISTTIQEYKDSMVQEPAEDFIHAIKAWADKKLNEL